jgi:hypothetical protein
MARITAVDVVAVVVVAGGLAGLIGIAALAGSALPADYGSGAWYFMLWKVV